MQSSTFGIQFFNMKNGKRYEVMVERGAFDRIILFYVAQLLKCCRLLDVIQATDAIAAFVFFQIKYFCRCDINDKILSLPYSIGDVLFHKGSPESQTFNGGITRQIIQEKQLTIFSLKMPNGKTRVSHKMPDSSLNQQGLEVYPFVTSPELQPCDLNVGVFPPFSEIKHSKTDDVCDGYLEDSVGLLAKVSEEEEVLVPGLQVCSDTVKIVKVINFNVKQPTLKTTTQSNATIAIKTKAENNKKADQDDSAVVSHCFLLTLFTVMLVASSVLFSKAQIFRSKLLSGSSIAIASLMIFVISTYFCKNIQVDNNTNIEGSLAVNITNALNRTESIY